MKPLPLESAATLAHIAKPPMLITDLIPERSITFIAGPTYSGKTFFALELARAVAFNQPFMGHFPVERPGNVLFIEQDSPKYDTGRALYSMILPLLPQLEACADGAHPLQALQLSWFPGVNLTRPEDVGRIAHTAKHLSTPLGYRGRDEITDDGCRLIILDTFRRHFTGNENDSDIMQTILDRLTWLVNETGASLLCLHHVSRPHPGGAMDSMNLRGSTAIEGSVDNIFMVRKNKKKGISTVTIDKARAIQPPNFTYRIVTETHPALLKRVELVEILNDEEEGEPPVLPEAKPTKDTLLDQIRQHPCSRQELLNWGMLNGVSRSSIDRWVTTLLGSGQITKDSHTEKLQANQGA